MNYTFIHIVPDYKPISARLSFRGIFSALFFVLLVGFSAGVNAQITITSMTPSPSPYCAGTTLTVNFNTTINGSKDYTVSLSQPNGSFPGIASNALLNQGSGSHSITITIPTTAVQGSLYTIHITEPTSSSTSTGNPIFTINALPTITGTFSTCIGGTTSLTGSGTPAASNPWTSATPSVATVNSSGVVTGVAAGTSVITYTDNKGCSNSATVTVQANSTIALSSASNNATVCLNAVMSPNIVYTIGGTATGATVTGLPSGVNGTLSGNTFTISGTPNTTSGIFNYTVTTTGPCTNAVASGTITVRALPTASINQSGTYCKTSSPLQLTVTGQTGGTFSGPAGLSITSAGVINFGASTIGGPYTVTYTFNDGTCSNTTTTQITVTAGSGTTTINGKTAICMNESPLPILGSSPAGGTWVSSNTGVATIDNFTTPGLVTPVSVGSTTITYTVSASGCTTTGTTTVTVTAPPTVSITGASTICAGSTTTLSPTTGGTWTSNNTSVATVNASGVVTGVAAGSTTFTFTSSTAPNCQATTAAVTVNAAPPVTVSSNVTICSGSSTTLTAGGAASYVWSPATGLSAATGASVTANPTATTTYTVTGTGANGCTNTAQVTVTVTPSSISNNTITVVSKLCSVIIEGSDATTSCCSFTYQWYANPSNNNIAGFTAIAGATGRDYAPPSGAQNNWYYRDVICADGTRDPNPPVVHAHPPMAVIQGVTNMVTCFGGSNGSVSVNVSDGNPSYTYQWKNSAGVVVPGSAGTSSSNSGFTSTISNLTADTYTFTVTDSDVPQTCTRTLQVTITQPAQITGTAAVSSTPTCATSTDATITVNNVSGGTAPYQYSFNGTTFSNNNVLTGVSGGTYTITIKDANGCTQALAAQVTVTAPPAIVFTATPSNATCNGGAGSIAISNVSGGSGSGYTYSKDNGATFQASATFSGLTAGSYQIVVKDGSAAGCTATQTISITQPSAISAAASAGTILCNGGTTTLTAAASGGTAPYQYSINGGTTYQAGNTFTVGAGSYTVTVKDANGCTQNSNNVTVSQPTNISANATAPAITCNGGTTTITVTASGGTPSAGNKYDFSINGTTFSSSTSPFTFTNQTAGTYSITVRDANGCTATAPVTIAAAPSAITANASAPAITCNGSTTTITVTASGGTGALQYSLDGTTFQAGNTFSGQGAGNYSITVRDANGCTATAPVTIAAAPSAITANATAPAISCNGATTTITVTASGGTGALQYSLDGTTFQAGNTFSGQGAGNYTITVRDANGCIKTTLLTIAAAPSAITANATAPAISCNGGTATITVTASGGTPSAGNKYDFSINGTTFSSSTSPFTFTNQTAGTYSITVRDANGCTATAPVTITQPSASLAVSVQSQTAAACNGTSTGSVTVSATGGTAPYQYQLASGPFQAGTTFSNVAAGTYTITVKDNNNCTATTSVTITQPAAMTIGACSKTDAACNGGSTGSVTAGAISNSIGTVNYSWKNASNTVVGTTATVNNLPAGTYTLTVTDNCSSVTCSVTISQPTSLSVNITSPNNTICAGSSTTLTATPSGGTAGYTYQWFLNGSSTGTNLNTFSATASGNYTVQVTDANNCQSTSAAYAVTVNPIPSAPAGTGNARCGTGTVTLSASGCAGGTLNWYAGASGGASLGTGTSFTTPSIATTTTYYVSCTINGCESSRTPVTATINTIPVAPSAVDGANCGTGTVIIDATGCTGTLQWYSASAGGSPIGSGSPFTTPVLTSTTAYWVSCLSAAGCEGPRVQVNATIKPLDAGSVAASQTICTGGDPAAFTSVAASSTDNNVNSNITYQWYSGPSATGPWTAIGGATLATYDVPAGLSATTFYYREATGKKTNGPAAGQYTCVVNSNVISITVNTFPAITTQPVSQSICTGQSVTFTVTATGTAPLSYQWKKGGININGQTSSSYTINSVAAGDAGSYTVTVTNGCGSVTSNAAVLTVPATLIAGSFNTTAVSACVNYNPAQLDINTPAPTGGFTPYSYQWQLSTDGGSTFNPVGSNAASYDPPNLTSAGTYIYRAIITDACGTSVTTTTKTITIVADPVVTINGNTSACLNTSTTFTSSVTGGVGNTYEWQSAPAATGPWSPIPGETAAAYLPPTNVAGTFYYRLRIPNSAACNQGLSNVITFVVNPLPTINGTLNVCAGLSTQLSGSGTAASSNPWVSSNTAVATVSNTGLVTGVAQGTATITYTDNNGCQKTATVTVNALPAITGTTTVCVASTTQLNGSGTAASTNPWVSSNTSIATVSNTGLVTGVAQGTAIITYTNSNGCQATTTITVNPKPAPVITHN